jgi:hypothetical protein
MALDISARIENVEYTPRLCKELNDYGTADVLSGEAFSDGAFHLRTEQGELGVSWWVTPKRTRSYPYTRVYDTMDTPRKVTIIPIVKDEGADGDRDYLKWSSVSLMSLLGVYVIPAYYANAQKNPEYENKITNQEFDYEYVMGKIDELLGYQSDALHWNMKEMERLDELSEICEEKYYEKISPETGVDMHSRKHFRKKMSEMTESVEEFKRTSKQQSKEAQRRELLTDQPKEKAVYDKGRVTVENFLGGLYHFTADEAMIVDGTVVLIEKKHTRSTLPSIGDIKDGLLKSAVFSNIEEAETADGTYDVRAGVGMTGDGFSARCTNESEIPDSLKEMYRNRLADVFTECGENGLVCYASPADVTHEEEIELVRDAL